MTNLETALKRISAWLIDNQPSVLDYLKPGLSNSEIRETLQGTSLNPHPAIFDLYQWHNGVYWPERPEIRFMGESIPVFNSLGEAISLSLHLYESDLRMNVIDSLSWHSNWLPIFGNDDNNLIFINCDSNEDPTVYYWYSETGETDAFYKNMESIMLGLAECYESGAYYFDANGRFSEDRSLEDSILRKYRLPPIGVVL